MKKKVALLLVLVMIITSLPMMVFGDAPGGPVILDPTLSTLHNRATGVQWVDITIDIGHLRIGHTNDVNMRLVTPNNTGGGQGYGRFAPGLVTAVHGGGTATPPPAGGNPTTWGDERINEIGRRAIAEQQLANLEDGLEDLRDELDYAVANLAAGAALRNSTAAALAEGQEEMDDAIAAAGVAVNVRVAAGIARNAAQSALDAAIAADEPTNVIDGLQADLDAAEEAYVEAQDDEAEANTRRDNATAAIGGLTTAAANAAADLLGLAALEQAARTAFNAAGGGVSTLEAYIAARTERIEELEALIAGYTGGGAAPVQPISRFLQASYRADAPTEVQEFIDGLVFEVTNASFGELYVNVTQTASPALGSIPAGLRGAIIITVPMILDRNSVTLSAEMVWNAGVSNVNTTVSPFLTNRELMRVTADNNLEITRPGDVRYFTEVLPVPPIRIHEGVFGHFGSPYTLVRLEAPAGYRWRTTPVGGVSAIPRVEIQGSVLAWGRQPVANTYYRRLRDDRSTSGNGFLANIGTIGAVDRDGTIVDQRFIQAANRVERVNFTRLNVMYLQVPTAASMTGGLGLPRAFEITNLHLVPEHGNNREGAVNIRVSTVPHIMPLDQDDNVHREHGGINHNRYLSFYSGRPRWNTVSLHVGTRVADGITVEVLGEVPTVRTGYLGSDLTRIDRTQGVKRFINESRGGTPRIEVHATGTASPNAPQGINLNTWGINSWNQLSEEQGVRTATVRLTETVPGAWHSNLGERLEFSFEHEGVRIMGATARAGHNVAGTNRQNLFPNYNYSWVGGWLVPRTTTTPWNAIQTDQIIITENMVTVIVPPAPTAALLAERRSVEVTFWVSVEAGFEAKFPGDTIDVTLSGPSIGLVSEANRTQTVAIPADPFSISAELTEIRTDILSTISQESISDIVITVQEPHLLREGSFIDVLIAGEGANMAIGLHIYANRTATVSGNGLIIGTGSVMNSEVGTGVTGGTLLRFPVSRVPNEQDNDGPITITITDVTVSGTVVPNVEYQVVVRNAVADNHVALGTTAGVGNFTSHPYFTPIVTFAGGILEDTPGNIIGITPELPPLTRTRNFWVGMASHVTNEVIEQPFLLQPTSPGGPDVSLVALREFGHFVGDYDPVWSDNGVLRAQITGLHRDGTVVTVAVENGRTDAIIYRDGVQEIVDIAEFAQGASGPAGTVRPLIHQGRFYLPLRFFAEAFGYEVTFDHVARVTTVRG